MLRFTVDPTGPSAGGLDLAGAYVVGSDGVPLRAELEFANHQLSCAKRADGPASVALLWSLPGLGSVLTETSRLLDRERPYNLAMELVRGRLMRINQKREEWGLYDFEGIAPVAAEIDKARDLFVEALKSEHGDDITKFAGDAFKAAFIAGEKLTLFHADLFLNRRRQMKAFARRAIGCQVHLDNMSEEYCLRFAETFDYAYLPMTWSRTEPSEGDFDWDTCDAWVEWLAQNQIPIKVGPLVSLNARDLPEWSLKYRGDYEKIRKLIFDHVRRVVERYGPYVHHWGVVSGVHADNTFGLTFEQLMELTRVTVSLVKQLAPEAQAVIDLTMPWGEYYARNQKTIPPLLYADMTTQSGVGFDAIGASFLFGAGTDGMFVRDMFQISEKLDRLGNFGKPVHITAAQVPSKPTGKTVAAGGGCWRKPWDEAVQAQWLKEFYTIALSKPFVESVTWLDFADRADGHPLKTGGLMHADMKPKISHRVLTDFRGALYGLTRPAPAQSRSA